MILRYIYADHNGGKQLVGCVCRTDDGKLGYSAVHPKDRRKLTKKLARTIALGRAEKCQIKVMTFPAEEDCWKRYRHDPWHARPVPHAIIPHLAALAALGPKGGV
jgi:hypothetical protein